MYAFGFHSISCIHFQALIVSKAYLDINIDWTDPVFHNVLINENVVYLNDFAEVFPITLSFLKNLIKRYDQLCSAFKQQQSRLPSKEVYNAAAHQSMSNSPSFAAFNSLLSLIHSQNQLNQIRALLEQLLERAFCVKPDSQAASGSVFNLHMTNCNIKDRYELAAQFNSTRITQRLMEADFENCAYLLDLKHIKKL